MSPFLDVPEEIEVVICLSCPSSEPAQQPVHVHNMHIQCPDFQNYPGSLVQDDLDLVPVHLWQLLAPVLDPKTEFAVFETVCKVFEALLGLYEMKAKECEMVWFGFYSS